MVVSANRRRLDEGGASAIEYAPPLELRAVVAITALPFSKEARADPLTESGIDLAYP